MLHTGAVSTTALPVLTRPEILQDDDEYCPSLVSEPLSAAQAADLAHVLKALADPTRLRLVSMVAAHQNGEACVCELTDPLGLTQPTISHHLKILVDAGIFTRTQRGKWAYYTIVPTRLTALATALTVSG